MLIIVVFWRSVMFLGNLTLTSLYFSRLDQSALSSSGPGGQFVSTAAYRRKEKKVFKDSLSDFLRERNGSTEPSHYSGCGEGGREGGRRKKSLLAERGLSSLLGSSALQSCCDVSPRPACHYSTFFLTKSGCYSRHPGWNWVPDLGSGLPQDSVAPNDLPRQHQARILLLGANVTGLLFFLQRSWLIQYY